LDVLDAKYIQKGKMTLKEIKQSIESMKVPLDEGERIMHWVNFFFMLIPLSLIGYLTVYEPILYDSIPLFGIVLVITFILFLWHKLVSPKLEVYKSELSEEQFKQANQAAVKLNEWIVISSRENYFSAIKPVGWQREGIKITAILDNGKLYLNSMVNPSIRSNPFTFGLNRKNKLELIRQYQAVLKGQDVVENAYKEIKKREEEFWAASEWNVGSILTRIVGYGLILIFLLIGILFIYEASWEGIFPILLSIGISLTYVKSDIQIIREKNQRKKLKKVDDTSRP
jgi:hypothetical protein